MKYYIVPYMFKNFTLTTSLRDLRLFDCVSEEVVVDAVAAVVDVWVGAIDMADCKFIEADFFISSIIFSPTTFFSMMGSKPGATGTLPASTKNVIFCYILSQSINIYNYTSHNSWTSFALLTPSMQVYKNKHCSKNTN